MSADELFRRFCRFVRGRCARCGTAVEDGGWRGQAICAACRPAWTRVEYIEFASAEEFRKFRVLPPLTLGAIRACDLERLARRLQEDGA